MMAARQLSPRTKAAVVIEFGGKYWTGYKFIKNKSEAMTFPTHDDAWNYVDNTFSEFTAETIGLERQR